MAASLAVLVGRSAPRLAAAATAGGSGGISAGGRRESRRSIVQINSLHLPADYPAPWPYKERSYYKEDLVLGELTKPRLHSNSKLIVVEGNIGAGKSTLAKELAAQFGMLHMPEFTMDDILIDRYGNDLRNFYHLFPKSFRVPDIKMFYKNPMDDMTAVMQNRIFMSRWDQFHNAIAHILNTGQGVVLERSPYTDFVFANAMRAKNYIGREYFFYYMYQRKRVLKNLKFWPHVVVYLDTPVYKCLENKEEIGVVDDTYLSVIAESYKDALKEHREHSRILAYDSTEPVDADRVVEDIEQLNCDYAEYYQADFTKSIHDHWFPQFNTEVDWCERRNRVTNKDESRILTFGTLTDVSEVAELYQSPRDAGHFMNVMRNEVLKGMSTHGGYPEKGDGYRDLWHWRPFRVTIDKWYDYYWRERYFDDQHSLEWSFDLANKGYDEEYVHDSHH